MSIASASRSLLSLVGLAFATAICPTLFAQSSSSMVADGFDPNVDGNVYAIALQPDGKLVIGGSFQTLLPNGKAPPPISRNSIARVLRNGVNDDGFNASVDDGQVNAIVLQPDGKILIGGTFTKVNGQTRHRVARLNPDGSLDAFDPEVQPAGGDASTSLVPDVTALALQPDGKVLVVGGFVYTPAGASAPVKRVVRFNADGSLDTGFTSPNPDQMVLAVAVQPDGHILIGGGFANLQPASYAAPEAHGHIAQLNPNGTISSPPDDPAPGVGSTAPFYLYANQAVNAIAIMPDGGFAIGGQFTTFRPNRASTAYPYSGIARFNADGSFANFVGSTDGPVDVIQPEPDGSMIIGGRFNTVSNISRPYVARIHANGSTDTAFYAGPNSPVRAIALQSDGSVLLGGIFTTLAGAGPNSISRNHVARASAYGMVDADFRPDATGRVSALAALTHTSNKGILVGGSFSAIAGETHSGIARLKPDGTLDRTFDTNINGPVTAAVEQSDGKIVIGGNFTRVNGELRYYAARLNADGSLDPTFDPSLNSQITAIAIDGSQIYLAGLFTALRPLGTTQAVSQSYIARVNAADGTLDLNFRPILDNIADAIVVQPDHRIVLGGVFNNVMGTKSTVTEQRFGIVRLNTDGTVDPNYHPQTSGSVYALALQSDGSLIAGGSFLQVSDDLINFSTRWNIARFKPDGTIDPTFDPRPDGEVDAILVLADGSVVFSGRFDTVRPGGGTSLFARSYVAHVTAAGAVDQNFDLSLNQLAGNEVVALAQSPTSTDVLVAGAFTSVQGQPRSRLVEVTAAGALETSFNTDISTAAGAPVDVLVQEPNGAVLIAGSFTGLNGAGTANFARFNGDSSPDLSFVPSVNGPVHAVALFPTKGQPEATQELGFAWLQTNGQLRTTFTVGPELTGIGSVTAIAVEASGTVLVGVPASVNGAVDALIRFRTDGSVDTSFHPAIAGTVSAIKVQRDGKILIGGTITTVGGTARNNMARLNADGTLDTAFDPNVGGPVLAIELQTGAQPADDKILIGGTFSSVAPNGGAATVRQSVARLNLDATLDTVFDPSVTAGSSVAAIRVLPSGKILLGGGFLDLKPNGATTAITRQYFARVNSDGTLDSKDFGVNGAVTQIILQPTDNKVIVTGYFTSFENQPQNYIARLNADDGLTLDPSFNPNPNGTVLAVSIDSTGRILIGGMFTALQPNSTSYDPAIATPRHRAARLNPDGTVDPTFNPNFDAQLAIIVPYSDNSVLAAGAFTSIQPFGSVLVGGEFSSINGVTVSNLALFGDDGSVSSSFLPNPDGGVYALLTLPDGASIVGGAFSNIGGQGRNRLARFTSDNALDASFNPGANNTVYTVARQPDGRFIVGGAFTNIAGSARNYLARLNADGSLDPSFSASVAEPVRALALQADGRILYATGSNIFARLNADGSVDGGFSPRNDGQVSSIVVQADGEIVVGGSFQNIGGGAAKYVARLKADGTLDPSVNVGPSGPVTAVAVQPDGKILFGGTFTTVDGLPRFGLARLAATTSPSDSFSASADRSTVTWTRTGPTPELSSVLFESSPDETTWTTLGSGSRVSGSSNWSFSGLTIPVSESLYIRVTGIVPGSPNTSTGLLQAYGIIAASNVPVISSALVVNTLLNSAFTYKIATTGSTSSYSATGLPPGLTLSGDTISGTPTQAGTFNVVLTVSNDSGSSSKTLVLFVGTQGPTTDTSRIVNLSVRATATTSTPVLAGFVIQGGSALQLLIRGVGPGLATVGVDASAVLTDPTLTVFDSKGEIIHGPSASWGGDATVAAFGARLGAFPLTATSADTATVMTLSPGGYTVHVSAPNDTTGEALAELYDATPLPAAANAPRLVNISARSNIFVDANNQTHLLTAGFVITGSTSKRVLIRGIGPGLTAQGVSGVIPDPAVTLYRRINSTTTSVIAQNDNWQTPTTVDSNYPAASGTDISSAASSAGAFALGNGSHDASILMTLPPGIYTAEVSGTGGATGAAMVEVYEVP